MVSNRNPLFQGSNFQVPCLTSAVYILFGLDVLVFFLGKSLIIRKPRKEEVLKDWILLMEEILHHLEVRSP